MPLIVVPTERLKVFGVEQRRMARRGMGVIEHHVAVDGPADGHGPAPDREGGPQVSVAVEHLDDRDLAVVAGYRVDVDDGVVHPNPSR